MLLAVGLGVVLDEGVGEALCRVQLALPGPALYLPRAQAVQLDCSSSGEKKFTGHAVHVVAPAAAEMCPLGQPLHRAWPDVSAYRPGKHFQQTDACGYGTCKPAGQSVQAVLSNVFAKRPSSHCVQRLAAV